MDLNCKICFEVFNTSNRKPIIVMLCGHTFCLECVDKLKMQNFICPIDREPITNQKPNYALLDFLNSKDSAQSNNFQMDPLNVSITEISRNQSNLQNKSQGEKHYQEALILQDSSKFRASIEHFDKAIHFNYDLENSFSKKGSSLIFLEKYDEAIKCFDKSLEINPNCVHAYHRKGYVLVYIHGEKEEGIKLLKKASEVPCNSNNCNQMLDKAQSLNLLDKNDEALIFIDKSIIIKPNALAYKIKAEIMWKLNKETEAIECYNKALNFNKNYFSAYWGKGICLKLMKKFKEAIESFDKAIQLHPTSTIYRLRAESYAELNENEKAVQSYINAIALDPEDEQSRNAMNEILEKQ